MGIIHPTCQVFRVTNPCLHEPLGGNKTVGEVEAAISFFNTVITITPVATLGIFANIISISVFARPYFVPVTTQHLLLILSFINVLHLTFNFLTVQPYIFCGRTCIGARVFYSHAYSAVGRVTMSWLELTRNWVTVLIGLERYLVTCRMAIFRTKWKKTAINTLVSMISAFFLLSRIPLMVTFVFDTMPPDFCRLAFQLFTVNSFIDACFDSIGPLILMIIFTIAIVSEQGKSLKLSTSQSEIRQLRYRVHKSFMILLSCMNISCITHLVNGCFRLVLETVSNTKNDCVFHVVHTTFFSLAVNSSVVMSTINFFIFVIFWKKFREELKETACSIKRKICCCRN